MSLVAAVLASKKIFQKLPCLGLLMCTILDPIECKELQMTEKKMILKVIKSSYI